MLVKPGPLDTGRIADLRPCFDSVPDPRARRGRWYSLTAILLVCACAVVSGARSIDELAEWGQRASNALLAVIGIRRHLLRWRRTPAPATIGRVLGAVDGDALDRAVGAYLADRHRAATEPAQAPSPSASGLSRAIAVDGKALKGPARLTATRRHLLSAVTHGTVVTLAQVEVGAKTNETTHFRPLLAPLDLTGTVVTFDALHSVKANISWPVETKKAHYIAVIKTNQPIAHAQLAALPWQSIAVQHTASGTGHGRRESRSIKTCGIADELGGIAFPHARLAIHVHRRRKQTGRRETRESVYAVTSLDAQPSRARRPGRRDPRALGSGELLAPHQGRHLRRRHLHRPRRDRATGHGNPPQPRHRRAENPRSRQHRQDHPGDPRRAPTSTPHPGHHQQSGHLRNLIKPCRHTVLVVLVTRRGGRGWSRSAR
ncbi:ISAs1 family transposase [Streptomyces sp. NBC_00996]|uniref:ISAs1 family transposase n=1 Tax=Streptomyces sp. NBC_00996 TaxID=2903710 RepID=UPI00386CF11C|nr:ISAs1 family transposase [Streptomyces sp. NBC_00996]